MTRLLVVLLTQNAMNISHMVGNKSTRRELLTITGAVSLTALAGCSGLGGIDGDVTVEVENIEISDVSTEERTELGTDVLYLSGTVENTSDEDIELTIDGQFYDSSGAELETLGGGCEEFSASTTSNSDLLVTDRVEAVESYELTVREFEGSVCV